MQHSISDREGLRMGRTALLAILIVVALLFLIVGFGAWILWPIPKEFSMAIGAGSI